MASLSSLVNRISLAGSSLGNADDSRNKLINGAMQVSQENGATSGTGTARYPVDQFIVTYSGSHAIQSQQVTDAGFEDFIYSSKLTVFIPNASLSAGDWTLFSTRIEGYNVNSFGFGKSWAKTITLSFWVQSSVTGTYCVAFRNSTIDRSYIAEYTIEVADTPEYKTITIPADTAGNWLYNNGVGLRVNWCLGTGTTYQTTAGSWQAGNFLGSSNQVNWNATTSNTFYLTGVQLEEGTVATEFEHRDYQTELTACLRYWETGRNGNISVSTNPDAERGSFRFSVNKRTTTPSVSYLFDAGTNATFQTDETGGSQVNAHSQISTFTYYANARL